MNDIQKVRDREYLVAGSYRLDDLNDEIGSDLQSEDYDSIGGYLVGLLDHFPEQGESVTSEDGYHFKAEKVDRQPHRAGARHPAGAEGMSERR